tara:strand:+ start:69 stop:704 length:636 start_codon:yes stop_codon:yes gene_type:complete
MRFLLAVFLSVPLLVQAQETEALDILFLKIQELEEEIVILRGELESQSYLIEKFLDEDLSKEGQSVGVEDEIISEENSFRFEGINDSESIDVVYDQAISELNKKNFQVAKKSFLYLANNFSDEEKIPLSIFWLGEISLLESNLEESEEFFQKLAANYPNHWRAPLAHKKIGDILMMSGEVAAAKIKYQYVVQNFPNNSASSLALQLLENME